MDDIAAKKLSKLSRGIGTLSGKLVRETPIFSSDSTNEYELLRDKTNESLDDLFLLRIRGKNTTKADTYRGYRLKQEIQQKEINVHKTYSTRLGNLIIYSDSLYLGKKRKHKKSKKKQKFEIEELNFEGTVEELSDSILRFGNGNFIFVGGEKGLRDEKVISVRPGYSPMRYIASVSKLWNPERVEKLLEENALKENHLQRYKKIKLPKIDIVPSSEYDPLLRDRPKPYTHSSLPDIFRRRDPSPSHINEDEYLKEDDNAKGLAGEQSSGYAKSFNSDGRSLERRKLVRKKTMQMKKLDINLLHQSGVDDKKGKVVDPLEEERYDSDGDVSDSISDWEKLVAASRNVVDRTFERLEQPEEDLENAKHQDIICKSDGKKSKLEQRRESLSTVTSDNQDQSQHTDYASLDQKEKEELISRLLLEGIVKEASTIDSLITENREDRATFPSENKIDLSEQISFPVMQRHPSISDAGSVKGFKGNALHGSFPSSNSTKSKAKSKPGSLKDSLVISSVTKLPPIKSEPATPNVNGIKRGEENIQGLKLPALSKRTVGYTNAKNRQKSAHDIREELEDLFIGGRGIDVNDVVVDVKDEESMEDDDDSDDDEDLIKMLREKESAKEEEQVERERNNGAHGKTTSIDTTDSIQPTGNATPDSGRSTGTGLTTASETNVLPSEQKANKEPMTPVAEESSRSSKALSRESTLNGTKSTMSVRQKSIAREKSSDTGSAVSKGTADESIADNEELVDVARGNEESTSPVKSEEDKRLGSILESDDKSESNEVDREIMSSESQRDEQVSDHASFLHDEGVFVEEENRPASIKTEDNEKDELFREPTNADSKTISDSIDIVYDEERKFDETKTISESLASRDSSGFLQVQARTAAQSALSRPRSGIDLIEDMKIAASEFGKMFGENIQREASRSSLPGRGRTRSDAAGNMHAAKSKIDKSRSMSLLSLKTSKRMDPVDLDMLKANITGLGALVDKKIVEAGAAGKPLDKETEEQGKELEGKGIEEQTSVKSFPAVSSKSDGSSQKDIQMDIISYVQPERENSKSDVLVHRESDVAVKHPDDGEKDKNEDTEEEEFQQALQAIVDEVKDLQEKKPQKTKKIRKLKSGPEEKYNIVRDRMSASPPFLAGRAKESKAPKGLGQIDEVKKKTKGKGGKKAKGSVKKVKSKKEAPEKKRVTFNEKVDVEEKTPKKKKSPRERIDEFIEQDDEREKTEGAENKSEDYDKYDVPMMIKQAKVKEESWIEDEKDQLVREQSSESIKGSYDVNEESKGEGIAKEPSVMQPSLSFVSSNGTETDGSLIISGNEESGAAMKHIDARMQKRKIEAEKRRLKVEQRRREKEEAKRKMLEQAEREERLKQEAETEMQRRMEEFKRKRSLEEEERKRLEEEEQRRQRRLDREREREKREKEELKKKMAAMQAKLKLEEEMRRERERIAQELAEEERRQEEEKLKQMEEDERIEYEKRKREEEEERRRLEEERERLERERRLIEEEEHRVKMQKLAEFHRMLLERAKFWEGMKNSKWFLEWNQRLTEAFTFSYFDLLPAMLFQFTSLRPFTPKENKKPITLPTIDEERKDGDP